MEHKISNELPPIPPEGMGPERAPSPEMYDAGQATEQQASQAIETATPSQGNPLLQGVPQAPVQAQPTPAAPTAQTAASGLPAIADDTDLIEKEWVLKAKEIVARTSHDPYQQNKEVERIKADYMKKRYNKDVKITED